MASRKAAARAQVSVYASFFGCQRMGYRSACTQGWQRLPWALRRNTVGVEMHYIPNRDAYASPVLAGGLRRVNGCNSCYSTRWL